MNGPKVSIVALVKFGYMLEKLSIWWYRTSGDNPSSAANQQERLSNERVKTFGTGESSETTRRTPTTDLSVKI
jgi:hypothetical protein